MSKDEKNCTGRVVKSILFEHHRHWPIPLSLPRKKSLATIIGLIFFAFGIILIAAAIYLLLHAGTLFGQGAVANWAGGEAQGILTGTFIVLPLPMIGVQLLFFSREYFSRQTYKSEDSNNEN